MLNERSLRILSNPPTSESLFPNLRRLRCAYAAKYTNLLRLPFPSLVSLEFYFRDLQTSQDALTSFSDFSPDIKRISLKTLRSHVASTNIVSRRICQWRNLQTMSCPLISLDADTLFHLSRIPALTQLSFSLRATVRASHSLLSFSNLRHVTLRSESLEHVSRFLCLTRLPAITTFVSINQNCPSRRELSSFLAGVRGSMTGNTIETLQLCQSLHWDDIPRSEVLILGLEELRPCMKFTNLRQIDLQIKRDVYLTDSDLLTLAAAWPRLEDLSINRTRGWNTQSGMTPNGLLQLLQICRSLRYIAMVLDTRGYDEFLGLPENLRLAYQGTLIIYVLDSVIETESVPAIAAFFAAIAPHSYFPVGIWYCGIMENLPGWEAHVERWKDVSRRVEDAVKRRY